MRIRNSIVATGERGWARAIASGLTDYQGASSDTHSYCIDNVGNYNGINPLWITHRNNLLWWVSGRVVGTWQMENFCVLQSYSPAFAPSPPAGSNPPTDNQMISEGMSKTNPNTPVTDVPGIIGELSELPKMLKSWGDEVLHHAGFLRTPVAEDYDAIEQFIKHAKLKDVLHLPRWLARKNLEWQFGVEPMLRDLDKLLQFQASVDKKLRVLEKLGSVSRNDFSTSIWSHSDQQGPYEDYASPAYGEGRRVHSTIVTEWEKWFSCRWSPKVPLPIDHESQRVLATQLAYGLGFSLATMWNLMPWSWLFDWFSNAGELQDAYRNTIPVNATRVCLMTKTSMFRRILSTQHGPYDSIALTLPPAWFEQKERTAIGDNPIPTLEYNLPFLNGRQTSILASLAVLRKKRRSS